jgi:poly(3-hydroxybutyrate) depolymerase
MGGSGLTRAAPAYWVYETAHATLCPARALANAGRLFFSSAANPLAATPFGKSIAAACELFERSTRRYGRPEWNINSTVVAGELVSVTRHDSVGAAVLPAPAF